MKRNSPRYNPKTPCPDCGNPKSAASARCRTCAAKAGYTAPTETRKKQEGPCQCGEPGTETTLGLDHEQITKILCPTHAEKAYNRYCDHVKTVMLDNITQQIKIMTG